jgi:cytoskeleton protein RodZ
MGAFGENLRRERDLRGVSLTEISQATKIGARLLDAIETERFERLPGGVFNSAFVRQYARYLGLDEDRVLAEFLTACGSYTLHESQQKEAATAALRQMATIENSGAGGRLPVVIAAGILLAGILVFSGWQLWRGSGNSFSFLRRAGSVRASSTAFGVPPQPPAVATSFSSTQAQPPGVSGASGPSNVAPGSVVVPLSDPAATPTAAAVKAAQEKELAKEQAKQQATGEANTSTGGVNLELDASDRCVIRVSIDGRKEWSAVLLRAGHRSLKADRLLQLTVENAGALQVTRNGRVLPPLGQPGESRTLTFRANGKK